MNKRKKLSPETQKVWNIILITFANKLRQFQKELPPLDDKMTDMAQALKLDPSTLKEDLGLEATIETLEGLLEKGIIRILTNEKKDSVWLEVYDPYTNSYKRC